MNIFWPSGGMADAGDLKSLAHWACGFESRLGYLGVRKHWP